MLRLLIIGFLLTTARTHPLNEELITKEETTKEIDELKQMLKDVSYVTNFKNMMASYIRAQHNNLTVHDMEKIQEYLEEFCYRFAKDLKAIVENSAKFEEIEGVNVDDFPDIVFDDVKKCIKNELPNLEDEIADQMAHALRQNLVLTRQRIDAVINDSAMAAIQND